MSEAIDKYKFPITYNKDWQAIDDAEGKSVAELGDIWQWTDADEIGEYIASAINEKHEREKGEIPEDCIELAKGSYVNKNGQIMLAQMTASGKYFVYKNWLGSVDLSSGKPVCGDCSKQDSVCRSIHCQWKESIPSPPEPPPSRTIREGQNPPKPNSIK